MTVLTVLRLLNTKKAAKKPWIPIRKGPVTGDLRAVSPEARNPALLRLS